MKGKTEKNTQSQREDFLKNLSLHDAVLYEFVRDNDSINMKIELNYNPFRGNANLVFQETKEKIYPFAFRFKGVSNYLQCPKSLRFDENQLSGEIIEYSLFKNGIQFCGDIGFPTDKMYTFFEICFLYQSIEIWEL